MLKILQSTKRKFISNLLTIINSSQLFSRQLQDIVNIPMNQMTRKQKKAAAEVLRRVIIGSHYTLRRAVQENGEENAESVWKSHLQDKKFLKDYTSTMHHLATTIWEDRNNNSRIHWIYNEIQNYFHKGLMEQRIAKEARKVSYYQEFQGEFDRERERMKDMMPDSQLKVLDVGSCYNPFGVYEDLDVTAIDLCPVVPEVKECDFLSLKIRNDSNAISKRKLENEHTEHLKRPKIDDANEELINTMTSTELNLEVNCNEEDDLNIRASNDNSITELTRESFDVVIFCLLISYIPSPRLRFQCCERAYELLKPNGILLIVTPDSRRSLANFHLAKLWNVTMQHIGFERTIYKKEEHYHGSVYRKALSKNVWKIDAENILADMKEKRNNVKIIKRFRNFDYDSVREMFYINQDLHTDKTEEAEKEAESNSN